MAKHPHRVILINKKTWRCTLPGCSFFVHLGLAHVLLGKQAICWECGEEFTLDEYALRDDQPLCSSCRSQASSGPSDVEINEDLNLRKTMIRYNVKHISELHPSILENAILLHKISDTTVARFKALPKEPE